MKTWIPNQNDKVQDNLGVYYTVVYVSKDKTAVALAQDLEDSEELYVFEQGHTHKFYDQSADDVFLIGPATDDVLARFNTSGEVYGD